MGAEDIDRETFEQSMSIIVKHRTDIDLVAERVGVKLADPRTAPGLTPARPGLAAEAARLLRGAAQRGVAVGTSEILDAFAALEEVPWTSQDDFREALAATIAKSQEDRRLFELLFERWFFRAAEAEAIERGIGEEGRRYEGGERLDLDELREQIRQAILEGDDGEMRDLARLAIAAFGRQGEGSGVIGVDVQRIRRTLGLSAGTQQQAEDGGERAAADRPRAAQPLRAPPAPRARARPDRAHRDPAPLAPAGRARPRAADQPDPGPGGGAPRRLADEAAAGDPRPRAARARKRRSTSTCGARCAPRWRPAACRCASRYRPKRPRRPEIYVLCDVSTSVTSASVFFLSVLHALHDSFRKLRSFVFIERISEVTEVFEHERDFRVIAERISSRGRRRRRLRLHRLRPGLARVPRPRSPTTSTRARP